MLGDQRCQELGCPQLAPYDAQANARGHWQPPDQRYCGRSEYQGVEEPSYKGNPQHCPGDDEGRSEEGGQVSKHLLAGLGRVPQQPNNRDRIEERRRNLTQEEHDC